MDNQESVEFETLVKRLQQHEEIIIQLLEIIASTNRKVYELTSQQINKNIYTLN